MPPASVESDASRYGFGSAPESSGARFCGGRGPRPRREGRRRSFMQTLLVRVILYPERGGGRRSDALVALVVLSGVYIARLSRRVVPPCGTRTAHAPCQRASLRIGVSGSSAILGPAPPDRFQRSRARSARLTMFGRGATAGQPPRDDTNIAPPPHSRNPASGSNMTSQHQSACELRACFSPAEPAPERR